MARRTAGPTADERIGRFVIRGRRLLSTRLACNQHLSGAPDPDPPAGDFMKLKYADEESIDAAMARFRPLTLDSRNEDLFFTDVFDAIRTEGQGMPPEALGAISESEKEWALIARPTEEETAGGITDRALAYRYMYGDLVHADAPDAGAPSFRMRLHAAQLLVEDAIRVTSRTLFLIRSLDLAGYVVVNPAAWTEQVSMSGMRVAHFPLVSMHMADLGTSLPESLGEPMGPEWVQLNVGESKG